MAEQVLGLQIALPDGSVLSRRPRVRCDNTGYDLPALFVGSEGTLGVITAVEMRLHPTPTHRVTAICGFDDLEACVAAGRKLRGIETIAALELIDGRAARLAGEHLGVPVPVAGQWLLLAELAGANDQTDRLAQVLDSLDLRSQPAVGVDSTSRERLWRVRESLAEVPGLFGPPLKYDVALPLSAIGAFAAAATELVDRHAPEAIAILFGHIAEGNLHLNDGTHRRPRRQRQFRARSRQPQAGLPVDVAHARRHRSDADRQSRLRPDRLPQPGGAVRLAPAGPIRKIAASTPNSAANAGSIIDCDIAWAKGSCSPAGMFITSGSTRAAGPPGSRGISAVMRPDIRAAMLALPSTEPTCRVVL
jgi:hypothetical protein